jgi:hypothetical protein
MSGLQDNYNRGGPTIGAKPKRLFFKPRPPQEPLNKLSPAQREQLHAWFRENRTYRETRELVRSNFGVTTSGRSLSGYYGKHGLDILGNLNSDARGQPQEI